MRLGSLNERNHHAVPRNIECNEQVTYEVRLEVHDGSGWSSAPPSEWVPMEAVDAIRKGVREVLTKAVAKVTQ